MESRAVKSEEHELLLKGLQIFGYQRHRWMKIKEYMKTTRTTSQLLKHAQVYQNHIAAYQQKLDKEMGEGTPCVLSDELEEEEGPSAEAELEEEEWQSEEDESEEEEGQSEEDEIEGEEGPITPVLPDVGEICNIDWDKPFGWDDVEQIRIV
jgi:Myb-like DNA-binding domain